MPTEQQITEEGPDDDYGNMNVNNPPTVETVIEFLAKFPKDYRVSIYEGEGGNWLQVHGREWKG